MTLSVAADSIEQVQTVLTIAGFDPSSGAGVTADLMVFAAHTLFGTACITGLTIQSTTGVRGCYPVKQEVLAETLDCLDDDLPPAGIKIGMLGTENAVSAVCDYLEKLRSRGSKIPIVVDPVLRSSSGRELLEPSGVEMLQARLLPLADWVTPNREELASLVGRYGANSKAELNADEITAASAALQNDVESRGGRLLHVLTTLGGVLPPNDLLLTKSGERHWLPGTHVETTSTHGTGCALSSALLCRLVLGDDPLAAATAAKKYVERALSLASPIGRGHGPMNHLWPLGQ